MKRIRPKTQRVRLAPDAYRQLCRQVLERDHWRCQNCGAMINLQVHHLEFRSHFGSDSAENLVTLCCECHTNAHRDMHAR
jgi:5-methylcytosine-specific restriction endonuclease McrA